MVGWWNVPKQCVPVQMFCDPWSPKLIVPETQCPWIESSLSLCIVQYNTYTWCKMSGKFQCWDIVFLGLSILGTRAPENLFGETSFLDVPSPHQKNGGVTGRPETMCPCTNVLGPLVPELFVSVDTMSLDWYIPVILFTYMYCIMQIMTEMSKSRDIVFPGRLIWGTRGPRLYVRGDIVSGHPVNPPELYVTK